MNCLEQWRALACKDGHSLRAYNQDKKKWYFRPVKIELSDVRLKNHLNGQDEECVGIWLNVNNEDHSHFCVFDFDDHNNRISSIEGILSRARPLKAVLDGEGIPHQCFTSGSGHGVHIWITFETAKRVDQIKELADHLLSKAGLERQAGGEIADGKVEVLPKGRGQQVCALPYGRQSKLLKDIDGSWVISEPEDFEVELYRGKKRGPKAKAEGSKVDKDAAFDCFVKAWDVNDRDEWSLCAICLHAAFGKEDKWAKAQWVAWSKTSDKFEHGDASEWNRVSKPRKFTEFSFWSIAKKHGYTGESPFTKTEERKLTALDFLASVRLIRDQSDVGYAELKPRQWTRIDTNDFKNACALALYRSEGKLVPEADIKGAQMIAQAESREAMPEHVALRFARVDDKCFVYLNDTDRNVVEIDSDGWRVNNDAGVNFRAGVGLPMDMPVEGDLSDLVEFLNVDAESMVFLLAWMVTAIVNAGSQCPIAILDGMAGSAKSSTLDTIVQILDPKVGAQGGLPASEDDLVVSAYQSAIMSFDNVGSIAKVSDALCRLSTGGGLMKRKLYSDGDVFSVDAMRPLIIAGLDPTAYKQDLIERLVRVSLTKPSAYMDEDEFREYREANFPRWRGALYSLVSRVLKNIDGVEQTSSRFGVFSRVGECVARALGHDDGWFFEQYTRMRLQIAQEAASADLVYIFLTDYLGEGSLGDRRVATSSDLYLELKTSIGDFTSLVSIKDLPGNARALSPRVVQNASLLEKSNGWRVTRGHNREFIFEKVSDSVANVEDYMEKMREHQNARADAANF